VRVGILIVGSLLWGNWLFLSFYSTPAFAGGINRQPRRITRPGQTTAQVASLALAFTNSSGNGLTCGSNRIQMFSTHIQTLFLHAISVARRRYCHATENPGTFQARHYGTILKNDLRAFSTRLITVRVG
jgi:hypothetical protein